MPRGDLEIILDQMRVRGWRVAIHNDYQQDGQELRFWLFTHPATGRFVKGEHAIDYEAVGECLRQALEASK